MLTNNLLALAITFILSLLWLRLIDHLAHRGWVDSTLSRKIIHIGTGPLFVLCWLLFNDAFSARYLAALVPLAITAQFALVGLGVIGDPSAVKAMSRSGDRKEILRGPLFYGMVFVILTIVFWKDSPIGIVALMLLCGGDGLADVIGSRWRSSCLPWSNRKSWAGSVAMLLGGFTFSAVMIMTYRVAHVFTPPFTSWLPGLGVIALVGTLVESLPTRDIDNLTVPVVAIILGFLVFR